jgi:hypothetical protein
MEVEEFFVAKRQILNAIVFADFQMEKYITQIYLHLIT